MNISSRVFVFGCVALACAAGALLPTYASSRVDAHALEPIATAGRWTELLSALRALPMADRNKPVFACYAALAYFGLNQVTAGSDQRADCARQSAGAARDGWTERLAAAQGAAERAIDDAIAKDCADLTASYHQSGGLAGCNGCASADKLKLEFSSLMAKGELTKGLQLRQLAVEPERLKQLQVKPLRR